MKNTLKLIMIVLAVGLSACQQHFVVTPHLPTEAALVAQAANNGLTTEINLPYTEVYRNLRQAYGHCIAYTKDDEFVYTDNRLEEHLQMGTLFARTREGAYLHKMLVEAIDAQRSRITLFVPKKYRFVNTRFKQDIQRALGQDELCNI